MKEIISCERDYILYQRVVLNIMLRMTSEDIMWNFGLDSTLKWYNPEAGVCESDDEPPVYINSGVFLTSCIKMNFFKKIL
jgi:hypothetical protein